MQSEAKAKALEQFTEYFVKNYPGPDTVIFDPKWHAPKIFAAASSAITAALSEKRAAEVAIKPLEWRLEDERDPDFPRWNAEWNGMVFSVFKAWWGKENKWGFVGGDCGFHHTEDEAKAAAQADYEQRIRSALVDVPVEPVTDSEAIIAWFGHLGTEWRRKDGNSPVYMTTPREYIPARLSRQGEDSAEVTRRFSLEWIAGARPPVHPNPMRGRQSFRSIDEAIAFMGRQAEDAQFVSMTEFEERKFDRSEEARTALAATRSGSATISKGHADE